MSKQQLEAILQMSAQFPPPAAHDDALAVYKWTLAQGLAPSAICLSGDTTGGNLAISTAMLARDERLPAPAALVVMSPALDFTGESESFRTMTDAPLLTPQPIELFKNVYFGDSVPTSPYLAPLNGDLSKLPATLIHVGSCASTPPLRSFCWYRVGIGRLRREAPDDLAGSMAM
ncbi:hypothetical protein A1D31_35980 [Bradyrhizobium liaoningense]|nr:hypothetical protein A1D31_35980 [Bradyrhizobium liaoningense]